MESNKCMHVDGEMCLRRGNKKKFKMNIVSNSRMIGQSWKWAKRIDIWISKQLHCAIRTMKNECKRTPERLKCARDRENERAISYARTCHSSIKLAFKACALVRSPAQTTTTIKKSSSRQNKIIFLAVYFHIFSCVCFSLFFTFHLLLCFFSAIQFYFHCLEYNITA